MPAHRVAKPRAVMGTPWWIRLALYVIVGLIGLVMTVLGYVDQATVDGWLGQAGSLAALIGGLFAAAHTGRTSDEPWDTVGVVTSPLDCHRGDSSRESVAPGLPVYEGESTGVDIYQG